jgi:hypothetical protein
VTGAADLPPVARRPAAVTKAAPGNAGKHGQRQVAGQVGLDMVDHPVDAAYIFCAERAPARIVQGIVAGYAVPLVAHATHYTYSDKLR